MLVVRKLLRTNSKNVKVSMYTCTYIYSTHAELRQLFLCMHIAILHSSTPKSYPPPQVILMSATIDSYAYTRYFAMKTPRGVEPAPAITVQGRTYRVIDFYLGDIKHVGEVRGYMTYMYMHNCTCVFIYTCLYHGCNIVTNQIAVYEVYKSLIHLL